MRALFEPYAKAESDYMTLAANAEKSDDARKNIQLALQQNRKLHEAIASYATANKDNAMPAIAVALCMQSLDHAFIDSLFHTGEAYTKHPVVPYIMQGLQQMSANKHLIGKQYTDITLPDRNGKKHRLSEYIGKKKLVLLECWASWCPPCMSAQPLLRANYKAFHNKGFEIVAVSLDSKAADWQSAINDNHLDWIHLSDLNGWDSLVAQTYGIRAIPFNLLIDSKGIILDVNVDGMSLAKRLAEMK